jgi:hypothetical protein
VPGLENARIPTNGLRQCVSRYVGELGIDVFDGAVSISNDDRRRALLDGLKELAEVSLRFLLLGDLPRIDSYLGHGPVRLKHGIEPELEPARADRRIVMNERDRRGDLPDDRHPLLYLVPRQQPIEVGADRIGPARPLG